ncbi:MAG: hypothetical protein GTN49_10775 [candidate division Zixibacteria bacterium]|nr:hypothetical protein [candidate division Zixibacteria bacterium]
MNGNTERKVRATQRFLAWLQKFHPEMHAHVMARMGEAPKAGALNQLGEAWDMFYPSLYYPSSGYRGRWHSHPPHLGQFDEWGTMGVPTTTDTSDGESWYSGILDFAKEAIPAYLAYDAQKDLMELNMERARQGLDPIDPGMTAPQVRVVHQLPQETQSAIEQFKLGGMNILLWGALAVGGFFLIRAIR